MMNYSRNQINPLLSNMLLDQSVSSKQQKLYLRQRDSHVGTFWLYALDSMIILLPSANPATLLWSFYMSMTRLRPAMEKPFVCMVFCFVFNCF